MNLQTLPWDVVQVIAENCGHGDCVALGLACPPLMPFIEPRLYRSIVFDLGPRALDKNPDQTFIDTRRGYVPISVVRTAAGLKRCLKILANSPRLASYVWSLDFSSNLPLSDVTLNSLVSGAFKNLVSLAALRWAACPELPIEVLEKLPNKSLMLNLSVDLALRPWQDYPEMHFESLKKLVVRPFLDSHCLSWLRGVTANACEIEELELCRFLDEKRQVGSSYAFVGMSDIPVDQEKVYLLREFFPDSDAPKLTLRNLRLMQFTFGAEDVEILENACNFNTLETLSLAGKDDPGLSTGLLQYLSYKTPKLKHLSLDWDIAGSKLCKYLETLKLESLDLTIHNNPLQVMKAVAQQKNLTKVAINVKCRFTAEDFLPLLSCSGIRSLKIPFNFNNPTWKMVQAMTSLLKLELIFNDGPNAPAQHHSTTNTLIACGLLSMWNDEFVYPLQYAGVLGELRSHTSLQVLEIDGHSHVLKPF